MDDHPAVPEVRLWLLRLVAMIGKAHFHTDEEWGAILDDYIPGLCARFPASAFDYCSLEGVAVQCRYWPGYADLVGMLASSVRERRPPVPAVEDAALTALAPDARHWVAWWRREPPAPRDVARRASLVRSQAPEAWAFLVRCDPSLLAHVPACYAPSDEDEAACWASEETVRRSIRLLDEAGFPPAPTALLRGMLDRHAPAHVVLLNAAVEGRSQQGDVDPVWPQLAPPAAFGPSVERRARPRPVRVDPAPLASRPARSAADPVAGWPSP